MKIVSTKSGSGQLKRESEFNIFQNKEDAIQHLFDYLEIFYNRQRTHSFLGYVSPED